MTKLQNHHQVFPIVDYEKEVSQRLVDAALEDDYELACLCLKDPFVEVDFVEAVYLKTRKAEIVLHDDCAHEVRFEYEELETEANALFLAALSGNLALVRQLLCGVDVDATDRALLQSSKPLLFANVDCNALVAAVVSRQISVVRFLLKAGVRTDFKVRLGAWSWDLSTGVEFQVGAALAEPYEITWCAVEYFEASGTILRMLLPTKPIKHSLQNGPTLIHHALICGNMEALDILLSFKFDVELPVKTLPEIGLRPLHLASRLGLSNAVHRLINAQCNLNSRTVTQDTALMFCIRHKREECLRLLASASADFGLTNFYNQSATTLAVSTGWNPVFERVVLDTIRAGKCITSSNYAVFAPLVFVTKAGDIEALKMLIKMKGIDLNQQDELGFTASMVAAVDGQEAMFRLLVHTGADLRITNKEGQTARTLSKLHHNEDMFDKIVTEYKHEMQKNRYGPNMTHHPLHRATLKGDVDMVRLLITSGYDVNVADSKGNTPLMLASRLGHGIICEILISHGAKCETMNKKGETALSMSKLASVKGNAATEVILKEMGRKLVLKETQVKKHRKGGKGWPHKKLLKMVEESGILQWGKNKKRKVLCKEAWVGGSESFRWNRRKKSDTEEAGLFHVVTSKNKSVHFVCEGGNEEAELWVRGIRIVTSEANYGMRAFDC